MRVIYSTPRLENAERVGKLLEDRGIGVRVLYGPHHRRRNWRGADYRQGGNPGDWPRVMVLNNGDLPLAREALRELGLMEPAAFERAKTDQEATANPGFRPPSAVPGLAASPPIARRVRLVLMIVILILVAIQVGHYLLSAS